MNIGDRRLKHERRLEGGREHVGCECSLKDCVNQTQCKDIYTQDMWTDNDDNTCPHYVTKELREKQRRRANNE
jgi:hypothetical protein